MLTYDAILVVSFGGPEGPEDVLPFLDNVLRGKNVPLNRKMAVAEHYRHFGGVSPINAQNRALVTALQKELSGHGSSLKVYWGNRNWHPLLAETLGEMARDGVKRALALFTSAYSSYSSCRQYREDIARAQANVGAAAPQIDKLRVYFNHPGFIEPMTERVSEALAQIPQERRDATKVIYTAHSIPQVMSDHCDYVAQLHESARLVSVGAGVASHILAFQSRSGPPQQPWLEPDVSDVVRELHGRGTRDVVVVPIGFLSDHLEIAWDLDTELKGMCDKLGVNLVRAGTVGSHPRFITMIRQLIDERIAGGARLAVGPFGPSHDVCPADCCLYPTTGGRPTS